MPVQGRTGAVLAQEADALLHAILPRIAHGGAELPLLHKATVARSVASLYGAGAGSSHAQAAAALQVTRWSMQHGCGVAPACCVF